MKMGPISIQSKVNRPTKHNSLVHTKDLQPASSQKSRTFLTISLCVILFIHDILTSNIQKPLFSLSFKDYFDFLFNGFVIMFTG